MDFFTEGSVIMDYRLVFSWKQWFKVKNVLMMDLFLLSSQDVNWWTGVVWITCGYCDVFINCLDSHSDGTHSLQRIYCWDTDAMLHFSKSDEEQTHLHLGWPQGGVHFQRIFIFVQTIPLTWQIVIHGCEVM